MNKLTRDDILSNDDFRAARQQHLAQVLAHQAVRRVSVGPHMTLLFENRTTMAWQIQEMCRIENITGDKIDHELATYNALLPQHDSLSATMLLEYPEPEQRDRELRRLLGLHEHVFIELGGQRLPARFDEEQFNDQRVSAVQFVRFPLTPQAIEALGQLSTPARIVVDHPAYQASADLTRATRGALLDDLDQAAPS